MRMKLAWLLLLPLGLALGCNGDNNDPDTDPPAGDDDDDIGDDDDDDTLDAARVRVLNLSDALGTADLFVERVDSATPDLDLDERAASEVVLYEDLAVASTSPYLTVAAGTREIELYATGADVPALEIDVPLAADMDHTVVVWGDLPDLQWLVIEDDDSAVPADAIAFEVMNLNEDETPMTVFDASPEPLPVIVLAQIPPDGQEIPAGTSVRIEIDLDVTVLGVDLDGDSDVDFEFELPDDLQPGSLNHLALRNDGAGGLDVFLVEPDGTTTEIEPGPALPPGPLAEIRIANLSPNLETAEVILERVPWLGGDDPLLIDRLLSDVLRISGMGDFEAIPFEDVVAGTRALEVYAAGSLVPLLDVDVTVGEGESATVFLHGELPLLEARVVLDDDEAIPAGEVALQITNLAVDVGEIDLLDVSDPGAPVVLADDLAVEATVRVDVAPEVTAIGIDIDDDLVADFVFSIPGALDADAHVHLAIGEDLLDVPVLLLLEADSTTSVFAPDP